MILEIHHPRHVPPPRWSDLPGAPVTGTVLCALTDLQDGDIRCLNLPDRPANNTDEMYRILIMRTGDQVQAYVNRCAHFGVPLSQSRDKLIFTPHQTLSCNVHYAKYRWIDGLCISGDCEGESLIPVPVQVNSAGLIEIGTAP